MLIVTPNPAIDHTVHLAELRPGEVIRTGLGVSVAGGKGGNVTRAARCLGMDSTVIALVPDVGAAHLQALYAAEGFDLLAVPVDGRVRTCTALIEAGGRVTLLNEPGPEVSRGDWAELIGVVEERMMTVPPRLVICSGSLPPGAPADGYAQVVRIGHEHGCEVVVDATGAVLAEAVDIGADLVCPNLAEAETMLGRAAGGPELVDESGPDVPARARKAAIGLVERGARWAVVTAGAAGVAAAGPDYAEFLVSPQVTVRNPIGAGDSFLAGAATARLAGRPWPEAIRRGVASGSASVEQVRAGVVDPARVDELERALNAASAISTGPHRYRSAP